MATSTVNLGGTKTSQAFGYSTQSFQPQINQSAPDGVTVQAFAAATFAAVTVPASASGVWIIPPVNNSGAVTLKGITGDTGITLGLTAPFWMPLASGAVFGLLCANAITVEFVWT